MAEATAQAPVHPAAVLYGALWQHAAGARGRLLAGMALLTASQLIKLALPWLAGRAIDTLQRGDLAGAGRWLAVLGWVYLLSWAVHAPGRILERNVGVRVREAYADALYARLAGAPLAWHDGHHSGELQHRVHQASRALSEFAQTQFVYLASVVGFFGPLVALVLLWPASGAIALAGYLLIALAILRFDRALMRLARAENDADRRYVAALLDFLANTATVIGLRLAEASRRLLRRRLAAVSAPLKRSVLLNEGKWFAVDLMGLVLTWGLVAAYVVRSQADGGPLMLGGVFMLYQYAQQAAGVVSSMAANFQSFARMHTDVGSAAPIEAAPSRGSAEARRHGAPTSGATPQATPVGTPPADADVDVDAHAEAHREVIDREAIDRGAAWAVLRIEGLGWRYPPRSGATAAAEAGDSAPHGLHGVTLELRRGQRIALMGPSGGGKSTLLRALAGLIAPTQGRLLIDGAPAEWRRLRQLATLIPQEVEVFEASVRENLGFGQPIADDALRAAMRVAGFDAVLAAIGGAAGSELDTPLSERGLNLSGGQRQRLGLARGVLAARGSSLLLLDEPTSALDAATEAQVFQGISAAFPDACLIASIHRPALLPRFDTVVVMESGRVVEVKPAAQGDEADAALRLPEGLR